MGSVRRSSPQAGFNLLLLVAGLATVPRDLYEAAAVDGAAGGWSRFRMVTWPIAGARDIVRVRHHADPCFLRIRNGRRADRAAG